MPAEFVQRGRSLCDGAQYQEAVKVCRLGLLAHPTEIDGRLVLGNALMALSRYDEVLAEMRVALELDADNPQALALKGEALLRKGDALQASDVLARAVSAAPSDPVIRDLYGEARRMREGGAPRPGLGGAAGSPRPSLTSPQAGQSAPRWTAASIQDEPPRRALGPPPGLEAPPLDPPPRPGRQSAPPPARGETVPPDHVLAVGDSSGTIEIDPEIEGVEVEMPKRSAGSATIDAPTEVSDPSIELSTQDILPGSDEDSNDQPFELRSSAAQYAIPPVDAAVDMPAPRSGGEWRSSRPAPRPVARPPTSGAPRMDELFPEDEEGVSSLELVDPRTGEPSSLGVRGPAGAAAGGAGSSGPSGAPRHVRSRSEDMRMIREGLGLAPESTPGRPAPGAGPVPQIGPTYPTLRRPAEPSPGWDARRTGGPSRASAPAPRRGIPLIVYALLALLVVGGAVLAGFKVRAMRLASQIEEARAQAARAAATDTYTGYLLALDAHARIVRADGALEHRAARAAIAARMAAELGGQGLDEARALVEGLGASGGPPDTARARGFLALALDDAAGVRAAAAELAKARPDDPDAAYLTGRAALLEGKPAEAAEPLRKAADAAPRPAALIALARAEAGLGRVAEARAALAKVEELQPGHARAAIWSALLGARRKELPGPPEPEKTLEAIMADGRLPAAEQTRGVAPGEVAWAALALAEVKLARGDRAGAKGALGAAQTAGAPTGVSFRSALVAMLIELGDIAAARTQVEQALAARPESQALRVLQAEVAMAAGDPAGALAALDKAGDLSGSAKGLTLRGRVRLAEGALDQAAADLDAALALRPDLAAAVLARAEVDLARGEARTAVKRLEPLYGGGAAAPIEVVAAMAAARRMSGDRDGARAVLDRVSEARPQDAGDRRILLELARLERASGAYGKAAELYDKAIAAAPGATEARLEAATLALDRGDAAGAGAQLDALVQEAGESGPVLVEAARARILTGDHAGATELLDRAAKLSSPSWKLARERGRLLLRQLDAPRATVELERARSLEPDDEEIHVLLLEAYWAARNQRGAARELEAVTKGFRGSPLVAFARGMELLVRGKSRDAAAELARAHEQAVKAKATPRELGRIALWTGRSHYLGGDLARATQWFEKALGHDASLADAHYLLGQIAMESGKADAMVSRYEKAVALDASGLPDAWYFIGEYYAEREKKDKARQALETYLSKWPNGSFAVDAKQLLQ